MYLAKRFHKVVLRRKDRGRHNQHYHHFIAGKASSNQHMTQQSVSGILIIGLNLERLQHSTDGADNLLAFFILDQTLVNGNHSM